ncbi:MAG: DUF2309 domain-containing protein [Bacteroidota bacterium]|nr:DUF2309 domain-containing protein [Bacteroidota bacterium]
MITYQEEIITSEENISDAIQSAWSVVAPFWPLKNIIAVNPLSGLEDLPFEKALKEGQVYFQQKEVPPAMLEINRQSIKWLQAFFDDGQATLQMPLRQKGFLAALLELLPYDESIVNKTRKDELINFDLAPKKIIKQCLDALNIPVNQQRTFLTLLLTTLPGWAAHVKYRANWADAADRKKINQVSEEEYLTFRILLTYLIWPKAKALLTWHENAQKNASVKSLIKKIESSEETYQKALLQQLSAEYKTSNKLPDAQLVFCIDVRSEPFRKALEQQGNYETLGFAGFFGVPIAVQNSITGDHYPSCPVLLQPAHQVEECPACNNNHSNIKIYERKAAFKRLYQSLKYTFTAPFALVETIGPLSGINMALRSIFPKAFHTISDGKKSLKDFQPNTNSIPFKQQCIYAENALRTMGLTKNFAPLVVFCGHGSKTQNNAYATALDCGACGGHHGAPNARILATILNTKSVRDVLQKNGVIIPETTQFLAAEHNTTTDEMILFDEDIPQTHKTYLNDLKSGLGKARLQNSNWRAGKMGVKTKIVSATMHTAKRAEDWAQVRPEWGLARNAAFIIAPRALSKEIDLDGRAFLHSYDWQQDPEGKSLTAILTAPLVVGQWINTQYLFSTIDNIAYGGGSKISKNITGKIGIMQGNASDIMCGLPLQSVYTSDTETYHEPVRLLSVVYAPHQIIANIIEQQPILQKLIGNGWINLVCIDPVTREKLKMNRDLSWELN